MIPEDMGKRTCFSSRLHSINERFPSLVYLGLAFWFAWPRLALPTITNITIAWESVDAGMAYSFRMRLITTVVLIICIFAFALFEKHLGRLPESLAFLCVGGAFAACGTALLFLSLYYAPTAALFDSASIIIGIGRSILLLRCMLLFGGLAPQRVLLMTAIAFCLASTMEILFRVLPVEAGIVGLCLFPLISMLFFALSNIPIEGGQERKILPNRVENIKPFGSFWRFAFTIFFVSLAAQSVVYFYSQYASAQTSVLSVEIVIIGVTLLLITYAIIFPSSYNFNNIYYPTILVIMLMLALLFVSPEGDAWPLMVSRAALQIFGLLIWCLLSYIAYQSKLSPIKVFGFGYGLHLLGGILGYAVGYELSFDFSSDGVNFLFICLILAIIVLAISIAIYPPRTMKDLLLAIPDDDFENPNQVEKTGAWEQVCNQVAEKGNLTSREREVMTLLAKGRGSNYISETLGVSLSTIYTHTRSIYRKLDVHSREELMDVIDNYLNLNR